MSQPTTMSEAKEQFQVWRSNKTGSERIPEVLWSVVGQILANPNYNRSAVTRGLGVSTAQLKKRFPGYFQPQSVNKFKTTPFVKASLAPLMTAPPLTPVITMERHNGVKLSLAAPTTEQFTRLIHAFMES